MSDTTRLIGQLKAWIESPSGFRALDGFVQTNLNRLTAGGSSALFSLQSEQHNFNRDDTKGNVEELRQEFVAFFMDEIERRLQRQPVLASHLQKGNFRFFLDHVWDRFVWQLQEKAREKKKNPRGYLFRRFREILSAHPEILTEQDVSNRLYFCCDTSVKQFKSAKENSLANETYLDWPLPSSAIPIDGEADIRISSRWVLNTARLFSQCAVSRGHPPWLAVFELVRYLAVVHPWLNRPGFSSAGRDRDGRLPEVQEAFSLQSQGPEQHVQKLRQAESIESLAVQLVLSWNRQQCCVYIWRLEEPPMTFAEIAGELDLTGHNQAYRIYQKTKKSLFTFCRQWPGPPANELGEDVAIVFLEKVREQAKNICPRP
jgi:hypothetical protein